LVRRDTIFQAKKKFQKRGEFEKEYIMRTSHISGRTKWDYAHSKSINPDIIYHTCYRSLRKNFYTAEKWKEGSKVKYTIFLSQAGYPVKGAHQVIKAAAMVKDEFPEIQIRIAGYDILKRKSYSDKLRFSGYANYLRSLVKKGNLTDNVKFLGQLDEEQMIKEYQNAHLFICPSSIENSPNSLAEAQMIGTPSIASFVGGIPDMITDGEDGLLFRFEETEMLAEYIRRIFTDDGLSQKLSINGIATAEKRHNRKNILNQMLLIYNKLVQ
jgi:glycosyltransferase involved in cell wall biosynthesis